jgi:uncharacterized protein
MAVEAAAGRGVPPLNHLKDEKSPYLLQHAANPVDWYPWEEEAFEKARREDKPVFLSIGYSTCHWCHVMEEESFEDVAVARLMNEVFVSIKVDREERPDLDDHYMAVSQALTGGGGWPLTIVMTPDGKPFFAATYVPRGNAYGRTGMLELVPRIGELWKSRREDVLSSANSIAAEIVRLADAPAGGGVFDGASLVRAAGAITAGFDAEHGGFGEAPKFPMPTVYPFLLRAWRRSGDAALLGMVEKSLVAMRGGGIYDHLGFGFHRYATDAAWRVPHFEKMLYDQALLALAYTEAWLATGNDFYRRTALEVFVYAMRDLRSPEGAFFAAEDADSEGEEGKFYLWRAREIASVLGAEDAARFMGEYGVSEEGTFDGPGVGTGVEAGGLNILYRKPDDTSAPGAAEEKLRRVREGRVRPFRDDKVLADWNGLMIAALSRAGAAFDEPSLIEAAGGAADFVLGRMRDRRGQLLHRWRDGEAGIPAFADDYAFLALGLLELYAAGFDTRRLEAAIEITDDFVARFWDDAAGGFFQAAADAVDGRALRRKAITDGVMPSANSAGLLVLARLAEITGRQGYRQKAEQLVLRYPRNAPDQALSFGAFFSTLDLVVGPAYEVVVAGDPAAADTKAMLRELRRRYLPHVTVLLRPTDTMDPPITRLAPFTASQTSIGGRATAYVCEAGSCRLPATDIATMLKQLGVR